LKKEEREKGIEETLKALRFLENELKHKFFGGDKNCGHCCFLLSFLAPCPVIEETTGLKMLTSDKFPKLHPVVRS